MDQKELFKFHIDFIEENNPDPEFVPHAKALLDWVSTIPEKDQELGRLYLTKLVDKLELSHLNGLLETKYTHVPPEERVEPEPEPRYFARSKQFKGLYPKSINSFTLVSPVPMTTVSPVITQVSVTKTEQSTTPKPNTNVNSTNTPVRVKREKGPAVLRPRVKKPRIEKKNDGYFCESWSDRAKPIAVQKLILNIIDKPSKWINHMEKRYQILLHNGYFMEYILNPNTSLQDLCEVYKSLEPVKFMDELTEEPKLIAKMKQSFLALALYQRVKDESKDVSQMRATFNELRRFITKSKVTNTLWRHCKTAVQYYKELGDMVVLSPEIFDKLFYLQYPVQSIQTFIDRLKTDIPIEVIQFDRLYGLKRL